MNSATKCTLYMFKSRCRAGRDCAHFVLTMFVQLPVLHKSFRDLDVKTGQIMHVNKKQQALSRQSSFPQIS